jgi:TolA-binding protein
VPVLPIDLTSIVAIVMGMLVVLIPVAGLTARFAFKPIAEAIAQMRDGGAAQREVSMLEKRIALLEQQFQNVEGEVERLTEEREFRRQLEGPRA